MSKHRLVKIEKTLAVDQARLSHEAEAAMVRVVEPSQAKPKSRKVRAYVKAMLRRRQLEAKRDALTKEIGAVQGTINEMYMALNGAQHAQALRLLNTEPEQRGKFNG